MNETTERAIFSRLGAMGILGLGIQGRQYLVSFSRPAMGVHVCASGFLSVLFIVKHTLYSVFPGIPVWAGISPLVWSSRMNDAQRLCNLRSCHCQQPGTKVGHCGDRPFYAKCTITISWRTLQSIKKEKMRAIWSITHCSCNHRSFSDVVPASVGGFPPYLQMRRSVNPHILGSIECPPWRSYSRCYYAQQPQAEEPGSMGSHYVAHTFFTH